MDRLSKDFTEKLYKHGTKAVIDHLEKVLRLNGKAEHPMIKDAVVEFIVSERDELENCAFKIGECLKKNDIPLDDVDKIFKENTIRSRRIELALQTIEKRWSHENTKSYQWDEKGVRFLEDLANIARKKKWDDAVKLFNRVILEGQDRGHWGQENHCAERPIKQAHLTKVLKHLSELNSNVTKKNARTVPESSGRSSIVPLGPDELASKGYKVDLSGLLIARSGYSPARSNNSDSPKHASGLEAEETTSQTRKRSCSFPDSQIDSDSYLGGVFNTPSATSSVSSLSSPYTEGGVDLTEFEGQSSDDTATKRAETKRPDLEATDTLHPRRDERPLESLICKRLEHLHQRMIENADKATRSQEDSLTKIIETIQHSDARGRSTSTVEATENTLSVDYSTKLMDTLEKKFAENSCKCDNMLTPQAQESIISGLYEALSHQLVQLKEGLEFTRSSISQGLSQQVFNLNKELVGQVRTQTQDNLEILYKATNDQLEQLHKASRDCIAHAGITIAGELKSISSAASAMTKNISNTLKKHLEESDKCQRQKYERSIIQMKHDISEKSRGIKDQQTVILTAIESQTKTIVSTMSTVQNSVTNMDGEIRDLRKDLEALRRICANPGGTDTANNTPEDGEYFENKNRDLEVVKIYQHNGNTAGTFKSTGAEFTASLSAPDAYIQGWREIYVDESNTAVLRYEIPGQGLGSPEMLADEDMTDVIDDSTLFAPSGSKMTVFTTCRPHDSGFAEYQNGSRSIPFPFSQLRPDIKGKRSRSSLKKQRMNPIRSKAGHGGGDRTAKPRIGGARIDKRPETTREARLRVGEQKDMGTLDHVRAQPPEKGGYGSVRPAQPANDSNKEDTSLVETSRGLIRDQETDLISFGSSQYSGRHDHFDSPESDLLPVQDTDSSPSYIRHSSTPTRYKTDDEGLDSFEASGNFAFAAVSQIRECQEDSQIDNLGDASEGSERRLLVSASEVMRTNAAEDLPPQRTNAGPATEGFETRPIASLYSNNVSSESLSNDFNHTTSGRNEAMIVVPEGCEANSLKDSDAIYKSSAQSRGQMQSSGDTDDMNHQASYETDCHTAAERKTPSNDHGNTSSLQPDSMTEQKVYGDQIALEERLGALADDYASRKHPGAAPGKVTREEIHRKPEFFEANRLSMEQLVHDVGKPDLDDSGETMTSEKHYPLQMASRSNKFSQHFNVADNIAIQSCGRVASETHSPCRNGHRTSDRTEGPESDLEVAPVTRPSQSKNFSQEVPDNEHLGRLDGGPSGGRSVTTPPLCPLIFHRDIATVDEDPVPSSARDERNVREVFEYTQKQIGAVRGPVGVSVDRPRLSLPGIALPSPLMIEDATDQGVDRGGEHSARQPEFSPFEDARGKKRSREPSDDHSERVKKSAKFASHLEEDIDADTVRSYMTGSEDDRCEKTIGSSDIEMTDSSTLDQNLASDPEESTRLGLTISEPVKGGWKALVEQGKLRRAAMMHRTQAVRKAIARGRKQREGRITTVCLEDSLFVPRKDASLELEHRETCDLTQPSATAEPVVEHMQIDTHVSTRTDPDDPDKDKLSGSSPHGRVVVEEESGVEIPGSSPDQQHVMTSLTQSDATTDGSAVTTGHMDIRFDSTQLPSDEHDELQSVGPVNKEGVTTTQRLQSSSILSQNSLSGSSAANSVSSFAHKENTQQGLEPNSSTVIGHVEGFDDFSQTIPELESDDIA